MNILNKFNLNAYMEKNKLGDDLESIKELSLIELHITKIEKGAFQGLKSLERLYLNNNQVIDIDDRAFEDLNELRELYLNNNNLRVIHSETFKGLANLEVLWLNNNRIADIDPNGFDGLSNVRILYLYANRLSKIDPSCFKSFSSIALIRLHDNEFNSSIVSYYNYSLVPWVYRNSYWAYELNDVGFVSDWNEFMGKVKAQAALIRPNAKWVWDNDVTSYFLNEKNSDTWTEYSKGKKTATFNFVLFDDMDPVIFDKSRNIYAKVCDRKTVFAFDTMDNLIEEKFYVFGRWHIKPIGSKVSIKISGKWVWEEDASHFLLNEKNSYVWSEYSNQNKLSEFEFILFEGAHPIIFDRSRKLYAKIKEKRLVFGKDTIEGLIEEKNVESVVFGHWQIRPSTELNGASPVPSNIEDHFVGKVFNYRYKVMRLLGKGAFGSVYLVHDQISGPDPYKKKAMKIIDYLDLSSENELTLRIWLINHENIIRFVDHFDHRISKSVNYTCIITEYCDNGDLKNKINEAKIVNRHIANEQILDWMLQATNGVRFLHSQEIIHRDIKPANMLLTKKNVLKLADLGLAKVIESTVGRTYAGSPAYMSPEIFESLFRNKPYYANTDVWSLGCVLYELITLKLAFPQGQKDNPPVPLLADCNLFCKVLSKMFEKDAEKRIDSKKLYAEFEGIVKNI